MELLEDRRLLSSAFDNGIWSIFGDQGGIRADDQIAVGASPTNAAVLQAMINGVVVDEQPVDRTDRIDLFGHRGDDQISVNLGTLADRIAVRVFGGRGSDLLAGGASDQRLFGGQGSDTLIGGPGNDLLVGGAGRDVLYGGDGRDRLRGSGGRDTLSGGWGRDQLRGGSGKDHLSGGAGADRLLGGTGTDRLNGGRGVDMLQGGSDLDRIFHEALRDRTPHASAGELRKARLDGNLHRLGGEQDLKEHLIRTMVRRSRGSACAFTSITADGILTFASTTNGVTRSVSTFNHSSTNTQESGVDEADIVETDGHYIYFVSNGELIIADARTKLAVASRSPIEGSAAQIYLHGTQLTILSGHLGQVVVTTLDVTDRTAPQLKEQSRIDGVLQTSRMIGGRLYLVLKNRLSIPWRIYDWKSGDWESDHAYRQRLQMMDMASILPAYIVTTEDQNSSRQDLLDEIYVSEAETPTTMTSVVLIDTTDAETGPDAAVTVMGQASDVYATEDALYVVEDSWTTGQSNIYKFALGADDVSLAASGQVSGAVLNQFSMDEEAGYFRVATTEQNENRQTSNSVHVLGQIGDELNVLGSLTGLAPDERIFSARFMGDQAYLVTFRQVDPLFALDLSNPFEPKLIGELKIPGFSSYLHPVGEDLLLGIGRDADADGFATELQLSLFDVSDMTAPKRIAAYEFAEDERSIAQHDHLAFNYFPESDLLAIPISNHGTDEHRLEVFRVGADAGIKHISDIEHDQEVLRSLWIGERLFSIGRDSIRSWNPAGEQDSIDLDLSEDEPQDQLFREPGNWRVIF